jgi:hypothetical protein
MRNWSSLMTPCAIRIWPSGRRCGAGEFISMAPVRAQSYFGYGRRCAA